MQFYISQHCSRIFPNPVSSFGLEGSTPLVCLWLKLQMKVN